MKEDNRIWVVYHLDYEASCIEGIFSGLGKAREFVSTFLPVGERQHLEIQGYTLDSPEDYIEPAEE